MEQQESIKFSELAGFQPKQKEASLAVKETKYTLFGGAASGGKSYFLRWQGVKLLMYFFGKYAIKGVRVGLFCEDYPALKERHLSKIPYEFPEWLGVLNKADHEFRLADAYGGGVIAFRNLDDPSKYLSSEFAAVLVDELTKNKREVFDFLNMRMRWPGIPDTRFIGATNPGEIGHGWVKKLWISKDFKGETFDPADFKFIQSKYTDNKYIDKSYEKQLDSLPLTLRRAYKDGDWDIFAGQYFCCDDKTEIFTDDGYKLFKDLKGTELVASLSPDGKAEFYPYRNYVFDYDGELLKYETPSVNFCVTPNHRMYVGNSFIEADKLPDNSFHLMSGDFQIKGIGSKIRLKWNDKSDTEKIGVFCPACKLRHYEKPNALKNGRKIYCCRDCSIKNRRKKGKVRVVISEITYKEKYLDFNRVVFCEFLGWYLSEGSVGENKNGGKTVDIAQDRIKNPNEYKRICEVLDKMGLKYQQKYDRIRFTNKCLSDYLKQFGKSGDKFIPDFVFKSNKKCLHAIFTSLVLGDGHKVTEESFSYFSKSVKLCEDTGRIATLLGYRCSVNLKAFGCSLHASKHKEMRVLKNGIKRVKYKGKVYCVGVDPYKTILIRREGKPIWTGNTEFSRDMHVCEPFPLPEHFQKFAGLDYGYTAPSAVVSCAYDKAFDTVYVYDELYQTGLTYKELAYRLKDKAIPYYADPSLWAKKDKPQTGYTEMESEGVDMRRGNNDRIAGWNLLRERLKVSMDGKTRLKIFSNCKELIRSLPELVHDKNNVEDVDSSGDDHSADALRYSLATFPFTGSEQSDYNTAVTAHIQELQGHPEQTGWSTAMYDRHFI